MPRLRAWLSNQELVLGLVSLSNQQIVGEKMYPGAKKVSISFKNLLTNKFLPIQSLNTTQHNTTQHNTTQHNTTQHIVEFTA